MYEKVKALCNEHGITISEMCKQIGISPSVISNWKKRNNKPNANTAEKIAEFFHVSISYFYDIDFDVLKERADNVRTVLDDPCIQLAKRIESLPADKRKSLEDYLIFLEQK